MARKRASFRLLHSATRIRSTVMKNADFFSKMKGAAGCGFSSSNKTWSSSSNSLSSVNAASPRKMRKPVRDYTVQTIINEELWLGVFCIYSLGNSLLYLLTRILHEEKYRCKNIQTKNCDTNINNEKMDK